MKIIRPARNCCAIAVLFAGLIETVVAAEIAVGGYSLDGWTVTGGQPPPAPSPRSLVLPAGSSISRTFSGTELKVRVTTQPTFSPAAENWPILSVGSASLAFIREGEEGKLALIVGQNVPQILPYSFKLDSAGRATGPVELELGQSAGNVSVSYGGKVTQFPTFTTAALEVVIFSGTSQPWAIDRFSVEFPGSSNANVASSGTQPALNATKLRQALATLVPKPAAPPSAPKPAAASAAGLEVFSPAVTDHSATPNNSQR